MNNTQDNDVVFSEVLINLLILSPMQLDSIQLLIRNMLQDLDLEELNSVEIYK